MPPRLLRFKTLGAINAMAGSHCAAGTDCSSCSSHELNSLRDHFQSLPCQANHHSVADCSEKSVDSVMNSKASRGLILQDSFRKG